MSKEIVINVGAHEKRIAVVEDGRLEEFLVERPDQERQVGNIYVGIVRSVQPGMQAAFVDLGQERSAFLSANDIDRASLLDMEEDDDAPAETHYNRHRREQIRNVLHKGQRVLVQVTKEPIGTKGPRVSMELSFAGRFVVLIPGSNFIGISKRTRGRDERRQLRNLIASVKPEGTGIIVRTIGLAAGPDDFKNEIALLYDKYRRVLKLAERVNSPRLLHQELGMAAGVMRDLLGPDITKVVVDNKDEYKELLAYLKSVDRDMRERVFLYREAMPLFDSYGIEKEIDKILRRKVWLKSGGYLIFDRTEALVAIDVNSGRFQSRNNQEETYYRTNFEAVHEIARQLRLRDIGGIIVIDLIDMFSHKHREHIFNEFCQAMSRDKAAHNVLRINDFGLMHVSRKRVRPEVIELLSEVCPTCGGTGSIFSATTVAARIDRCLYRNRALDGEKKLQLEVSHPVALHLSADRNSALKQLMKDNRSDIDLFVNDEFHTDEFRIYETKTGADITEHLISDPGQK